MLARLARRLTVLGTLLCFSSCLAFAGAAPSDGKTPRKSFSKSHAHKEGGKTAPESTAASGCRPVELEPCLASVVATPATTTPAAPLPDPAVEALSTRVTELEKQLAATNASTAKVLKKPWQKGIHLATPDGKFTMHPMGHVQFRFTHQALDDADDLATWEIRRMTLGAEGLLGNSKTEYNVEVECATVAEADTACIQHTFDPAFKVRLGQVKMPVARQWLGSLKRLMLNEPALATRIFAMCSPGLVSARADLRGLSTHGMGRSVGLQLWGDVGKESELRYFLGAFNGSGTNVRNDNSGLMYLSRVEWHPFGDVPYTEGALDRPKDPLLSLDLGLVRDLRSDRFDITGDGLRTSADRLDRDVSTLGFAFKWRRTAVQGEYFRQWTHPDSVTQAGIGSNGWYYMVGGLLSPDNWELTWTDSVVKPDRSRVAQDLQERGFGLNYYIEGHDQKIAADVLRVTDEANPIIDQTRVRVQYQFCF